MLLRLKNMEVRLGRGEGLPRWSPRSIDLDLLAMEGVTLDGSTGLQLPHPQSSQRSFVLSPWILLKHDAEVFGQSVLTHRRRLAPGFAKPLVMGIVNITPDSFSDGGEKFLETDLEKWWQSQQPEDMPEILDLGAQSTRPGAEMVAEAEELERLRRALRVLRSRPELLQGTWLSVDTFRPRVAAWALEQGVQMINDVGGLLDPEMVSLARQSKAPFVFMHQLGLPASREKVLPETSDPVAAIREWGRRQLTNLLEQGLTQEQLFFDPGIGFGKNATQSWQVLQRAREFQSLPLPLVIGHSRKSALKSISETAARHPDGATLAVSLALAQKGVEILRVHDFTNHRAALFAQEKGVLLGLP